MFIDRSARAKLQAVDRSQAVIEFALDGTILHANKNFLQTLGYQLAEIKGQHHSMFVDPAERNSAAYQAFWQALRKGEYQQARYRRIAKGGRDVWIQASYNPLLDRAGRPVRIVKFATDITTEVLRNAESEGKIAAMGRSQAVIEFELDGTIITANQNFLDATGYRLDEIAGKHHRMFMPAGKHDTEAYRTFWAGLARGEFQSGEFKRVGQGGKDIWLQATYNPILDPAGKPLKVVKFALDITADKLRAIDVAGQIAAIDKARGVIQFSPDGTILGANENFLKAVGYRLEEITGRHHRMFVEASDASSPEYAAFWDQLRRGQFHAATFKRIGKGGRQFWIEATYNPILDEEGRVLRVVKYCMDITAAVISRRDALDASGQTLGRVQTSAAAVEELSASISEISQSTTRSKSLIDHATAEARAGDRSTTALEKAAASMNGIVQVIQGVGEKINLLALNAAIEAAQAGEFGRGFAVVAGEVKGLSSQVTRATSQIAEEIRSMQEVSNEVVGSLRTIGQAITEIQNCVDGIAASVEQQSAATQEISRNMQGAAQGLADVNRNLDVFAA